MPRPSLPSFGADRYRHLIQGDVAGLLVFLIVVILAFGATADNFLSAGAFTSIAFQLPELGLLTLAM